MKAGAADAGGFFALAEATFSPGFEGPLVHGEPRVDAVYVLEGVLSFRPGGDWFEARSGALFLATPGEAPVFANRSEDPARTLNLTARLTGA